MVDKRSDRDYGQPMPPPIESYIVAKRRFLQFLSEKLRSFEITEEDYDRIVREGTLPIHHAGVLGEGEETDKPLPQDDVTTAARWLGLHTMEQRFGELYPNLKSQIPRSRDGGRDR